jgi:hypothetical protein
MVPAIYRDRTMRRLDAQSGESDPTAILKRSRSQKLDRFRLSGRRTFVHGVVSAVFGRGRGLRHRSGIYQLERRIQLCLARERDPSQRRRRLSSLKVRSRRNDRKERKKETDFAS